MQLRDPMFVRKMLAERANELYKSQLKIAETNATEAAKTHTVPQGGIAVRGGQVVANNPDPGKIHATSTENEDGVKTPVFYNDRSGPIQGQGGIAAPAAPKGGFSNKRDLPVHKEIDDIIGKMKGMSEMNVGGSGNQLTADGQRISATAKEAYQNATLLGGPRISPQEAVTAAQNGKFDAKNPLIVEEGEGEKRKVYAVPVIEFNGRQYPAAGRERWTDVTSQYRSKQQPKPTKPAPRAQQGDVRKAEPSGGIAAPRRNLADEIPK
jgi:hypothetical protein